MKNNIMKKNGFTLLEVVISIMIISIISVGIYTGYMFMIRQVKAGQVKQEAALEGKKIIEGLRGSSFQVNGDTISIINGINNLESMIFEKEGTVFKRYLNNDYNDTDENKNKITKDTAKYIETISITTAQAVNPTSGEDADSSENIDLSTNKDLNSTAKKIYISKSSDSTDYISYWDSTIQYDLDEDNDKNEIPLLSESNETSETKKMQLSIFVTPSASDTKKENVKVFSYKGVDSLIGSKESGITQNIGDDLVINFSNYKNEDGTLLSDESIEISIYNETPKTANIYLEKQTNLAVDVESCKGDINVHDNKSESNDDVGTLYNFKVSVTDKNSNILFTGYYKKNIH